MEDILYRGFKYLYRYNGWIVWNLFLAFIPLFISFLLFRKSWALKYFSTASPAASLTASQRASKPHRSAMWWVFFAVYAAFLPNAPYVLTDIIHLIQATWATPSVWVITLFYIPLHLGAITLGFEAYVISSINQGAYLRRIGLQKYIFAAELLTHFLCSVGIYLGRFLRFNSWDLVTDPHNIILATLNDLTGKRPAIVVLATAFILAIFYWIMKQVTIGLLLRARELRKGKHTFD
ncbi:DUF1361 domain-containing protein [Altericista sp. CCNU0014]|uniref:DUF1361 domain-containing protein n=1 Tax=Altericista sp. CCNU0014 TaxID=3082949 RepID=UPI00384E3370